MFAYLIIAIELLLLYIVYWYACVWKPKPYTLHGNLWGKYEDVPTIFPLDGGTSSHRPFSSPPIPLSKGRHRIGDGQICFSQEDNMIVSKRIRGSQCRMKGFTNDLKYGWVIEQKRRRDENIVSQIASFLNKALTYLTFIAL
jgi:hypothetical protein